ncbi:hypothetical protein N7510_006458 [Penicillium lagena]|uniref:uncharacterized protein n=1 Tax=Penicillium lagena TaxID=94218 RepID=UPI002541B961|nr:uncharacterized protein N7510_006458 [Penicillium lagena]KAJ5613264.1 hypothetical protein N7510_006458 [Penicillium lagena]
MADCVVPRSDVGVSRPLPAKGFDVVAAPARYRVMSLWPSRNHQNDRRGHHERLPHYSVMDRLAIRISVPNTKSPGADPTVEFVSRVGHDEVRLGVGPLAGNHEG